MSAKIVWQTKAPVVIENFLQKRITSVTKGGNTYNHYALMALSQCYDVSFDKSTVKYKNQSFLNYFFKNQFNIAKADVTIKEIYPAAVAKLNQRSKNVALIHHIDENFSGQTFAHKMFFKLLSKKLPEMDLVIVVSEYWREQMQKLGCKNIQIIYNSFNPEDYEISETKISSFRQKFKLTEKPIIYIGNAHRQKGVYDTYEALKTLDVQLIMTGANNKAEDIPVRFLSLNKEDYVMLLHASSVVVLMSKLNEGWNRVAHEALLCKTPVIGSGIGGMHELLTKSGQIITTKDDLKDNVISTLQSGKIRSEKGYEFVKQFDMNYFNTSWQTTIKNLLEN
ncbi:MAG: glycosyltransferase [Bacteroidetes bacterium]|jgi:glycosyltransferase involved in cell wall biosynthesis|nr:glycosyltransferase [Bacteroidota bacterium]